MEDYTSFIPGGSPVPEPPGSKYVGIAVSVVLCVAFSLLIVFVIYEFVRDTVGNPIEFRSGAQVEFDEEKDSEGAWEKDFFDSMTHFRLLSPLPKAWIASDTVTILCTWKAPNPSATMPLASMPLWIDDIAVPWSTQFGSNTWLAHFKLKPGEHRFRTTAFEESFYIAGPDAGLEEPPKGWQPFFMHENVGDEKLCGDCHYWIDRPEDLVRAGRGLTIGAWKGAESCVKCHEVKELERKHLHSHTVYEDCALCHVVHGTTEPERPLLKASKKRLCVQCHVAP